VPGLSGFCRPKEEKADVLNLARIGHNVIRGEKYLSKALPKKVLERRLVFLPLSLIVLLLIIRLGQESILVPRKIISGTGIT
jgi:hypothetical protein